METPKQKMYLVTLITSLGMIVVKTEDHPDVVERAFDECKLSGSVFRLSGRGPEDKAMRLMIEPQGFMGLTVAEMPDAEQPSIPSAKSGRIINSTPRLQ